MRFVVLRGKPCHGEDTLASRQHRGRGTKSGFRAVKVLHSISSLNSVIGFVSRLTAFGLKQVVGFMHY